MKIKFLFIACFITQVLFCQNYKKFTKSGDSLYQLKKYEDSYLCFKKAIEAGDSIGGDIYDAACSASLAGKKKEAFTLLNLSIQKGYHDANHLKVDSDLISLHEENDWKKVVAKAQKASDSADALIDKPLKQELDQIYKDDQKPRIAIQEAAKKYGWQSPQVDSINKEMSYIDSINLLKVIKVLDEKGWVGRDKVGNSNISLWLVIQHADLKTQEKYLPSMREAVKNGAIYPNWLALTEDRVALREGKKQIYGSQIGMDKKTNTNYVSPLEDPDNVDKRRAEVGLGPLAEYVKQWNIVWNVEEYKKQLPELEKKQNEK